MTSDQSGKILESADAEGGQAVSAAIRKNALPIDLSAIARELRLQPAQVEAVVALADEGNTVPFITRYRKERTGNLNEEQLRAILERVDVLRQLAEKKATVLRLIEAQGKLTPELRREIERADSLKRLDDLYLPYRPKKRTRAAAARERGLEPFAEAIWSQSGTFTSVMAEAGSYVDPAKDLPTPQDVLQGASDILAERISEDAAVREVARRLAWKIGHLASTAVDAKSQAHQSFRDYFNHKEPVGKLPPHRVLAFNRGEAEGALRVKFDWNESEPRAAIAAHLRLSEHRFGEFLFQTLTDALDRLITPAMEREIRRELTEKAQAHAVAVFARNLRSLLLQPPMRGERVLAIDPGFRTGCKTVVLDETGTPLAQDVVFVTGNAEKQSASKARLAELMREHGCRVVAIGNGTACRETEELVAAMIAEHLPAARYVIVNEAGASIYSTSAAARDEFPHEDATVRGTISIGRRLQDPLSELVKVEPQHIGVGLYQHDLDEKELQRSLDQVIESCVNYVGVDLNTASAALLRHVSGLNQLSARRIVEYRQQHGPFKTRRELKEVAGIGQATFTQAAGFLKIPDGPDPLDATWIHPESYAAARKLLAQLLPAGVSAASDVAAALRDQRGSLNIATLATDLEIGAPTLQDIVDDLCRPGRDPRADQPGPIFRQGIMHLEDLQPGMELQGTVLNVVDFGAFVDVGLKESGLVHISQLATEYVRSPHDVVAVGDVVKVWVQSVDLERKRVALTRIPPGVAPTPRKADARVPPAKPRQTGPHQPAGHEPLRTFGELKRAWTDESQGN